LKPEAREGEQQMAVEKNIGVKRKQDLTYLSQSPTVSSMCGDRQSECSGMRKIAVETRMSLALSAT
jgi:hypothetical protein